VNENEGTLEATHRLQVTSKNFPGKCCDRELSPNIKALKAWKLHHINYCYCLVQSGFVINTFSFITNTCADSQQAQISKKYNVRFTTSTD